MPALVERPKMSLAMWAALKTHIMKQREKKKQEQEADAAVERLRREQEMKRKQDAMTLEEIRDQLSTLEKKLKDLKNEKHELFLYLKRVLNEDDKRRSEEDKEPKYNNDAMHVGHSYPGQGMPIGASNMYMIAGNHMMNRNQVLYKVGATPQQNGAIKRQRSPSPPTNTGGYPQGFTYKTHVTSYGPKQATYGNAINSGYYPHSTVPNSASSSTLVVTNSTPYAPYPVSHPSASLYTSQDQAKHISAGYHVPPHMPQPSYGQLHQQIDHSNQKPNMHDEKYYIQTGGISSGYPVRSQPQSSAARLNPPNTHRTSPIQVPARKDDILRRNMANENQR